MKKVEVRCSNLALASTWLSTFLHILTLCNRSAGWFSLPIPCIRWISDPNVIRNRILLIHTSLQSSSSSDIWLLPLTHFYHFSPLFPYYREWKRTSRYFCSWRGRSSQKFEQVGTRCYVCVCVSIWSCLYLSSFLYLCCIISIIIAILSMSISLLTLPLHSSLIA